jgi:hypothetical protein
MVSPPLATIVLKLDGKMRAMGWGQVPNFAFAWCWDLTPNFLLPVRSAKALLGT